MRHIDIDTLIRQLKLNKRPQKVLEVFPPELPIKNRNKMRFSFCLMTPTVYIDDIGFGVVATEENLQLCLIVVLPFFFARFDCQGCHYHYHH